MNFKCVKDLSEFLVTSFLGENAKETISILPELCPPNMSGDITINCFRLARPLRSKPDPIADKAIEFFSNHSDILKVEKIKAFVNVSLTSKALYGETLADTDALLKNAVLNEDEKVKTLIEYSAPNTNKPLHLGHLRNNTLGMGLVSLLRRVGNEVVAVNLIK